MNTRRHRHRCTDLQRIEALERQVAGQAAQIKALQRAARRRHPDPTVSGPIPDFSVHDLLHQLEAAAGAHRVDAPPFLERAACTPDIRTSDGPSSASRQWQWCGVDPGAGDDRTVCASSLLSRFSCTPAFPASESPGDHAADAFGYIAKVMQPIAPARPRWWRRVLGWLLRSKSCGD